MADYSGAVDTFKTRDPDKTYQGKPGGYLEMNSKIKQLTVCEFFNIMWLRLGRGSYDEFIYKKGYTTVKCISIPLMVCLLLLTAAWSFAADFENRTVFIEGTAEIAEHQEFFLENFNMEAVVLGLIVSETRDEAEFTARFQVRSNSNEDEPYIVLLALVENATNNEIVSLAWAFADINDMYRYNQLLLYNAVSLIPPSEEAVETTEPQPLVVQDLRWQNQRLYIRLSADYVSSLYLVHPHGLYLGFGIWGNGEDWQEAEFRGRVYHSLLARPGGSIGFEWHFLRFMGLELNAQATFGDFVNYSHLNFAANAQLKFIARTPSYMISPYVVYQHSILYSQEIERLPVPTLGAGVQVATKGIAGGAWFVDFSFLYTIGLVARKNTAIFTPEPAYIYYRHLAFGISAGHKFGVFTRR